MIKQYCSVLFVQSTNMLAEINRQNGNIIYYIHIIMWNRALQMHNSPELTICKAIQTDYTCDMAVIVAISQN